MTEQERKHEVLKFTAALKAAGVAKVFVSYHGEGDEGFVQTIQFENLEGAPIAGSGVPAEIDVGTLGDLLEGFVPEGYENGDGGHGTITFDLQTQTIRIEHNWYEIVSNADEPREV